MSKGTAQGCWKHSSSRHRPVPTMMLMQVSVLLRRSPYCADARVPTVSFTSAVISAIVCCSRPQATNPLTEVMTC